MSKEFDSELYNDLYGDEDNEYAVPLQEQADDGGEDQHPENEDDQHEEQEEDEDPEDDIILTISPGQQSKLQPHALPAKPATPDAGLSYSAQIARQFSAYQQTPSQERTRIDIPGLPTNPNANTGVAANGTGLSAIATHEGGSASDAGRPVRPSEMKDEGKMFIGGLNWDTTDEGLRKYFSEFGKVDACTIMRDPDGRSRGFAFLTFEDPTSVNAVVTREHFLDGKAIDPKRAIPREEHLRNTRYFLGGLSPTTTAESVRAFFTAYGKVVDATVMVDRETGRSKGFGFVTFEDAAGTDQLVGRTGLIIDDKQIEVKTAQPRSQREASRASASGTPRDALSPSMDDTARTTGVFPVQQQAQTAMGGMPMMYPRMMGPMMGMGMGMAPMMGAYPGMGFQGGMGMGGMGNMGGMGAPMGGGMGGGMGGSMGGGMGMGMGGMGMGRSMPGMPWMGMGGMMMNPAAGMGRVGQGLGPARMTNRGQHHFHPYAR